MGESRPQLKDGLSAVNRVNVNSPFSDELLDPFSLGAALGSR